MKHSRPTGGLCRFGGLLLLGLILSLGSVAGDELDPGPAEQGYIELDLNDSILDPPAIAADGTLYISFRHARKVAAFSRAGERLWEFAVSPGGPVGGELSWPVIAESGQIHFGGGNKVFALNPDGTLEWELALPQRMAGAPALTADGVLLFGTLDRYINAVLDGKFLWRTLADADANSSPAVTPDGTIYFLNRDGLTKMTPNGTWLSGFRVSCSSFSLNADGSVYLRRVQPWSLGKLDPTTEEIVWSFLEPIDPPPVIAPDESIYTVARSRVYRVNPDGAAEAEYDLEPAGRIFTPITLAADGTLFAVAIRNRGQGLEGVLYKIAPEFASHEVYFLGPGALTPVALGPDGTAYTANDRGKLFIFEGNSPLPEQGWPSHRLDAAQTASLAARPPVPETPSNLTAGTGAFAGMVRVSWDEPLVFALCDIFRATSPDFAQAGLLAEGVAAARPFHDYEVEPGVDYHYWVRARNRSGNSPVAGPVRGHSTAEAGVVWTAGLQGPVSVPSVGLDGVVYVTDSSSRLHAVDASSGTIKWSFGQVDSQAVAAIAPSGWVIMRARAAEGALVALNPAGELQWRVEGAPHQSTLPAVAEDGTIYWGTGTSLRALTLAGEERWTLDLEMRVVAAPVIGLNGIIFLTTRSFLGDHLRAIHPGGADLWTHDLGAEAGALTLGPDGTIYVAVKDDHLHAVDLDGTLKWKAPIYFSSQTASAECVIAPEGTVIAQRLNAFDPDGRPAWHVEVPLQASSFTAAVSSQSVVFASAGPRLYSVDRTGEMLWEYEPPEPPASPPVPLIRRVSTPALGDDGRLYFGAVGILVAMQTAHSPALEGWTQFRGNAQRTGRLVAAPPRPRLSARRGDHPAMVRLEIHSPGEGTFRIDISDDLKIWRELITIESPQETLVIDDILDLNQRFYRYLRLAD